MSVIERAIEWALSIAEDDSHGYDQASRWGPNYDCSSLVISAFEVAGTGVKTAGATYTGNMRSVFLKCGFEDITNNVEVDPVIGAGLKRGDVLLNQQHHTAICLGGGTLVQASINEKGEVKGGASGDQTGREIYVRGWYSYPWDCILRYTGEDIDSPGNTEEASTNSSGSAPAAKLRPVSGLPILRNGSKDESVRAMQDLLNLRDNAGLDPDGAFGQRTKAALESYQKKRGLDPDAECGPLTWAALLTIS